VTAAIWLIVTQWLSAAVGGYIAGRLRTRWIGTHTHEVFFRDTAHGLITWAVATLFMASLLTSGAFSSAGAAGHAASAVAHAGMGPAGMEPAGRGMGPPQMGLPPNAVSAADSYEIDRLLRSANSAGSAQSGPDLKPEVSRIIANAATAGGIPEGDRAYLAQVVAARTGVSQPEAQKRVDDLVANVQNAGTKAKEAADSARKAAAEAAIYLALSLLVGAFIASVSAALGGRLRDEHP
jgi:hypothetical protein